MYKISDKKFKEIINTVIDYVNDNKKILKKLNEEDKEFCEFELNIDKFVQIFESYKSSKIEETSGKKILISHYGNPYITAMLCIEGLIQKCEITIAIEDICYALNKAIVKIINDALKEANIGTKIILENNITNNDIQNMDLQKIVCLGNSNSYMSLRKIRNTQVSYVPLFDIVLYYDSDKYESLAQDIMNYANQNFYEIEIFDETEDFEDVIYMINHDINKYCAVILSKDLEKQKEFKQNINAEIICVNENPFNKFELKIPKEIF